MRAFLLLVCLLVALCGKAQYAGPIAAPSSGYGAWGTFGVDSLEFTNPADPSDTSLIYFPQGTSTPVPTIFFMHGNGGNTPAFNRQLFYFIASKGFACVYVPFQQSTTTLMAYAVFYNGFITAARSNPNIIDTTRVGFIGHSFGGGACYFLTYSLCGNLNWGSNGRFLMPVAQWYTFGITESELQTFPTNTYLLSVLYDKDSICDHRVALDAFNHVSIPPQDKDMVLVTASQYQSYNYTAYHTSFNTTTYDALDVFVTFRLLDAMMDFVFNQNQSAKTVCLGDGSAAQTSMPAGLNPLIVSDTLSAWHPEPSYAYQCSDLNNPRWPYCGTTPLAVQSAEEQPGVVQTANTIFLSNLHAHVLCTVTNSMGQVMFNGMASDSYMAIPIEAYPSGVYFLRVGDRVNRFMK